MSAFVKNLTCENDWKEIGEFGMKESGCDGAKCKNRCEVSNLNEKSKFFAGFIAILDVHTHVFALDVWQK